MVIAFVIAAIVVAAMVVSLGRGGAYYNKDGSYRKVTTASSFRYCMEHPALEGIGQYVLPWENGIIKTVVPPLSLRYMCMCLGYDARTVAEGINFLIEMRTQNKLYHYDYYSPEEKAENSHLDTTKLLYVPGEPGKPFAMVIAGGGFNSVCMMQEAFPIARELHKAGYHVFMLKYRVGKLADDLADTAKRNRAFADLGKAMTYVFDHAGQWDLSTGNYSVWGFSAGARMTLAWMTNEDYNYQAYGLPKPLVQIPIYTMPENIMVGDHIPATFMAMGTKDEFYGEDGCRACEAFCRELKELGTRAVFAQFEGVKHGFGLGAGTAAEGWFGQARKLWEDEME